MLRRPPRSTRTETRVTYPTLFRSNGEGRVRRARGAARNGGDSVQRRSARSFRHDAAGTSRCQTRFDPIATIVARGESRAPSHRPAADREPPDEQRRLAHARRHALPALAAHADALVEREITADPLDAGEPARPVADQRRALYRPPQVAVLAPVRLGARKHELARDDIDQNGRESGREGEWQEV